MSTESEVFQFLYAAATYIVTGQDLAKLLRLAACFTGVGATVAKRQPGLGSMGETSSPFRIMRSFLWWISVEGIADRSAFVYGCSGLENSSLLGLVSDELAQIHDADVVRNMTNDRHIVRDKHIGDAQLILQIHQQVEDLPPEWRRPVQIQAHHRR